jgi:hypothetical protein
MFYLRMFRKSLYALMVYEPKAGKNVLSPRFEPNDKMLAENHNNSLCDLMKWGNVTLELKNTVN